MGHMMRLVKKFKGKKSICTSIQPRVIVLKRKSGSSKSQNRKKKLKNYRMSVHRRSGLKITIKRGCRRIKVAGSLVRERVVFRFLRWHLLSHRPMCFLLLGELLDVELGHARFIAHRHGDWWCLRVLARPKQRPVITQSPFDLRTMFIAAVMFVDIRWRL